MTKIITLIREKQCWRVTREIKKGGGKASKNYKEPNTYKEMKEGELGYLAY